jgi:hypothetical protein
MQLRTDARQRKIFKFDPSGAKQQDSFLRDLTVFTERFLEGGNVHVDHFKIPKVQWQQGTLSDMIDYPSFQYPYKPVDHLKTQVVYAGGEHRLRPGFERYITVPFTGIGGETGQNSYPTRYILQQISLTFPEMALPPNWERYSEYVDRFANEREKFKLFRPSLNTGFSLITFLVQYRDMIKFFESWLKRGSLLRRFRRLAGSRSYKELLLNASNEWLELQYGTLQLGRDLSSIFKILSYWKKNADIFVANANKNLMETRFISRTSEIDAGVVADFPFGIPLYSNGRCTVRDSYHVEAHGTVVYKYDIPHLHWFLARLAQLSDSFGISLDVSVLWDLIPFSFVLDWFVDVGGWLHRNRIDSFPAKVTFVEYGRSTKIQRNRSVEWWCQSDAGGFIANVPVANIFHTNYVREVAPLPFDVIEADFDPNLVGQQNRQSVVGIVDLSGWNGAKRSLNASALAFQQFLKRRLKRPSGKTP